MSRTQTIIIAAAVAALLAPGIASAQAESPDAGALEEADAGAAEVAPAEPELEEPFLPEPPVEPAFDDGAQPQPLDDLPDGKPFAKGDMEPGVGLAFAGYGGDYYMMIGASFAYYVVNHFAPGLEVSYGTDFGSANIPDSVTLLPFAKFVILRSTKFAPYLIALAGREVQFNGYNSVHSWIVGAGAGVHIGLGEHVALRIQITFQHHWYDDLRIRVFDDDRIYKDSEGQEYLCDSAGACDLDGWVQAADDEGYLILCNPEDPTDCVDAIRSDKSDLTHGWIFPIISIGMSFSF